MAIKSDSRGMEQSKNRARELGNRPVMERLKTEENALIFFSLSDNDVDIINFCDIFFTAAITKRMPPNTNW